MTIWQNNLQNLNRQSVLRQLGAAAPPTKILVEDQGVDDIIDGIVKKHKECVKHYDRLLSMFDGDGSWYDVGERLFDFCKQEIDYRIESVQWQYVSTPMTILTNGYCDCKGYALFCAGVLDAMKRDGQNIDWCYRFASYSLFNSVPGHVFVVINPKTDNIWLDPVMNNFNQRSPRPIWKQDVVVETCRSKSMAGIGFIPKMKMPGTKMEGIGVASAVQKFLDSAKQYSDGMVNAVQTMQASGTLNTICVSVLATASLAIPVIAAAWAIVKLASTVVSDTFGPGSEAALLLNDIASNPLTAPVTIVETLFNGRTYQSDQYRAAQWYGFYVLGNASINALNKVPDSMVAPAHKWFMDRTGVFISGAEHILGLMQSPAGYNAIYAANSYTTTDQNRVNAASNVAQQWQQNGIAGSWANTLGVYDGLIAETAQQQNESVESAAAQAGYQGVYSSEATSGPAPVSNSVQSSFPVLPALLLAAAAAVILIPSKK